MPSRRLTRLCVQVSIYFFILCVCILCFVWYGIGMVCLLHCFCWMVVSVVVKMRTAHIYRLMYSDFEDLSGFLFSLRCLGLLLLLLLLAAVAALEIAAAAVVLVVALEEVENLVAVEVAVLLWTATALLSEAITLLPLPLLLLPPPPLLRGCALLLALEPAVE
jgi:hypothetical protein